MKALQEEEDTESDACQDSRNSNTPVENNLNISVVSKDENNFSQILNPGNKTISNLNSALGGADSKQAIEGQQRRKKDSSTVKAGRINTKSISSSTVQAKQSVKMTSSSQMLSSASKKTSQKKSLVSSAINHKSNQPQKNVPGLQHKVNDSCLVLKVNDCCLVLNYLFVNQQPSPANGRKGIQIQFGYLTFLIRQITPP